ncbi:hypothetical protein [Spirillospora sp. NPDC047279]|uniref:hypothetical protein n=1 Tax=Spirillospora sp. NPDC047279 TaxID=3155478 RepID=UPI0033E1EC40
MAGGARLGAALARDGALPRRLGGPGPLAAVTGVLTVPVVLSGLDLDAPMRATAACLAAVTVLAMAAAVRLLPGRGRAVAVAATAFSAVVVMSCGLFLLLPAVRAADRRAVAPRGWARMEKHGRGAPT